LSVRVLLCAIAALVAIAPVPASAHWQYSRWGMTLPQLLAAGPKTLFVRDFPDLDIAGSHIRAGSLYVATGLKFSAAFGFSDDGHLNRVTLYPQEPARCR
jgi:hypothetical protein